MMAVSGMTFEVVPADRCATVTTAGSKVGILRVTIAWMASTTSHAAGIGSTASLGMEA